MGVRTRYDYELDELQRALLQLSDAVQAAIARALWSLQHNDESAARRVAREDKAINVRRADVEERALQVIAAQQPLASDLRFLLATVHVADELERIGDYAVGTARLVLRHAQEPDESPPAELGALSDQVRQMLRTSVEAFAKRDAVVAATIEATDDCVDALTAQIQASMLTRISATPRTALRSLHYLFVAHNLERIGDRAVNIAERTTYLVTGKQPRG